MCYVGGPRCTPHARQRFERALRRVQQLVDERDMGLRMVAAIAAAEEARAEYDATPGGIADLVAVLNRPQQAPDGARARLQEGVQRRIREVDAQRQREGKPARGYITLPLGGRNRRVVAARPLSGEAADRCTRLSATNARAKGMGSEQVGVPVMFELHPSEAARFQSDIAAGKQRSRFGAAVYVYPEQEYRDMRLFTTDDGKAGVALHDDEIVSLYGDPPPRYAGQVHALLSTAIEQGGRRCDCFDTVLPSLYAPSGMVATGRVRWDDEYAPEGWDKQTFAAFNGGEPDVVFLRFDPAAVGGVYKPGSGQVFPSYELADEANRGG